MDNLFTIILAALFFNNIVLIKFLGMCPFIGVSRRTGPALGMSAAVTFVMTIASVVTWAIFHLVLKPLGATFLDIVIFIFVIASLVQIVEVIVRATSPTLYHTLGIYLPLITTNCAILGVSFLNIEKDFGFIESVVHGISAGAGFSLALLLMSGIRERLDLGKVPKPFRGVPIAFITAAVMSMAFLGLSGFG